MIDKEYIAKLVSEFLEGSDRFLCDVQIKQGNIITITIDSDTYVSIENCIHISKSIESKLNRDVEDFELRVTSFGADKPIKFYRQYLKNIGRQLDIIMTDDRKVTGILRSVENNLFKIENLSKKKNTTDIFQIISMEEIREARVVLKFK